MSTPGKLAIAGIAGIVVAWGLSFAGPRAYASQTTLSVDGPATPQARADLIDSLSDRAWTRVALASIIGNLDLYPKAAAGTSLKDLTTDMRKQISVKPADSSDSRFVIRFEYADPYLAQKVVIELLRRLMAENDRTAQLGIPSAYIQIVSPAAPSNSPLQRIPWTLLGEGLVAGLVVGALLTMRKPRSSSTSAQTAEPRSPSKSAAGPLP